MSAWDLQQTTETIRANIEARFNSFSSDEQMEKNAAEYKAEKIRKCKIRMILAWRAKQK